MGLVICGRRFGFYSGLHHLFWIIFSPPNPNGQNTVARKKRGLKAFPWSGADAEQGIYPTILTASIGMYTSLMTGQYTTIPSSEYVVDPPFDTKVSRSLLA